MRLKVSRLETFGLPMRNYSFISLKLNFQRLGTKFSKAWNHWFLTDETKVSLWGNCSFKQVEPSKTVNTRIKYAAAYSLLTSLTPLQN